MSSDKQRSEEAPTVFQATVSVPVERAAELEGLHLDLLPGTEEREAGRWRCVALVRLDELEPLVSAGAQVVLEQAVTPGMPQAMVATEEAVEERLEALRQFREEGG